MSTGESSSSDGGDTEQLGDRAQLLGRHIGRRVEAFLDHEVPRVAGPREIVHPRLDESHGDGVAIDLLLDKISGGADMPLVAHRQGQADVPVAEVGVELAIDVELVGVPAGLFTAAHPGWLEDRDLWKPLPPEHVVAVDAGPGEDLGQL